MGYVKIVSYGDITEIYQYEKKLKVKTLDALRATRLQNGGRGANLKPSRSVAKDRQKRLRIQSISKGLYKRSKASINRSRGNFKRLCHHNNVNSTTIHFLTLTFAEDVEPKKAQRHVAKFLERVAKSLASGGLRYISVPERTKKGRLHFHLLVYDLPPETAKKERITRNFQRSFRAGFLDFRLAKDNSIRIAGYMAKYMAKALGDSSLATRRGYTCSQSALRFTSQGSNTLAEYLDLIVPTEVVDTVRTAQYNVPYLGMCDYKQLKNKK